MNKQAASRLFLTMLLSLSVFISGPVFSQAPIFHREEIKIPDIPGYLSLKCDFHMHTVFSDGLVWPTVRVDEAWSEGLDAISITDHIEYLPHKKDMNIGLNRSYEIAAPRAGELSLLLIRGTEVTKSMPTGHYNAIFLTDINPLNDEDYRKALKAAADQGAFIFWNHPGWRNNRDENGLTIWHPQQTVVFENGWMHGIEVANGRDYYPNAHRWCLEKKLAMIGSTDIHQPITFNYNPREQRTMTLVFAREKSLASIKEALFDRRTAVYMEGQLYGERRFLEPIFEQSVEVLTPRVTLKGKSGRAQVMVGNRSGIAFQLAAESKVEGISFRQRIKLLPQATVLLWVSAPADSLVPGTRTVELPYRVENLHLSPEQTLPVKLAVEVTIVPEPKK